MAKKNRKKKAVVVENPLDHSDKSDDEQDKADDGLKCQYCDFSSPSIEATKEHEDQCEARKAANVFVTFDGKVKFVCTICNQLFKYQTGLIKHELRHQPPGGFVCSECKQQFLTDAERLIHKETVHKMFKCMICSEKFTSEETFLKHIDDLHEGKDREYVVCGDCGAQFRQKNQLKLHNESKCGTIRCYTCKQCNSKFMTQNTLNAHMMIHTGEKKHLCGFCGNAYLSRGQLKIHERRHTGEKPYQCNICKKSFAHRESMVTHSSIHTGIKPFMCQCCGNKFSCIGNVLKHRRTRPDTCGLPQYQTNVKCAPRASTKIAGRLTIKQERQGKRTYTKRKEITVPELLSEREEAEVGSKHNKPTELVNEEPNEMQIMQDDNQTIESSETSQRIFENNGHKIEILEQQTLNAPISCSSNAFSYNLSQNNILIMTPEGNYILTGGGIAPKPAQPEQIIILNGNELHFSNDDNQNQNNVEANDIKEEVELIIAPPTPPFENPIAVDVATQCNEDDPDLEHQFLENNIEHLEIIEAEEEELDRELQEIRSKDETTDLIEIYECEYCSGQFRYKKSYLKHLQSDHGQGSPGNEDSNSKSGRKLLKCQYCDKQYTSKKLLKKHMNYHGTNGALIHKCPCCPLYFASKDEAQQHSFKEHEDRLKCTYCNKMYKDLDCIAAHIRKLHTKTGAPQKKYTFVCAACGSKFHSRVALSDHEQADCGRSPIYKCQDCFKCLHSAGSLKTHQLIHSGDLPFPCSHCKKRFRTQGQVKVHERSHTGEKPFACSQCDKTFGHRESLMTHMSLHTGIKRFMCKACGNRFSCISNLKAHRRTHRNTCGQLPLDTKAQWTYNLENGSVSITENVSVE